MAKHHLDGVFKNLAVIRDDIKDWWADMRWNALRLRESVQERDFLRIPHYLHAFVTTSIEKLYRLWGAAFWIWLAFCIA